MSYILDALRRADAERERGGVPGLHAQQPQRGDGERRRRSGLPWAGIAAALGLSLLVVLAWLVLAPASPPPVVMTAPAPLPVTPAPAEPAPVQAPTPAAPVAAAPAPSPAVQPPQQPALPPPVPVPVARAPAPRAEAPKPQAAPAAPAVAPAAAPASAAPTARLPALRELPEETRRQLPNLVIGGSTWSENAASRFVILNGQLLRENDAVTPELVLRQIRQRAVVLEFRGQRFELSY